MSRDSVIGRLVTQDEGEAAELAATLLAAGYAAHAAPEPTTDGQGWQQVVQTDAPIELLKELAEDDGVRLEMSDPMSGITAPVHDES